MGAFRYITSLIWNTVTGAVSGAIWFLFFFLIFYYFITHKGIQKALPDNERCLITIAYADGPDVPRGLAPLLRSRPSELDRMPYVIAGCCADVHFLVNISKTAAELTLVGNFVFLTP